MLKLQPLQVSKFEVSYCKRINKHKSGIFFSSNNRVVIRAEIQTIAGVTSCSSHAKYRGLPLLMVGRNRSCAFEGVIEKARGRVSNQKNLFLSPAGKEVLLKVVIQAIPTYSISMFILLRKICQRIKTSMSKFWWGKWIKKMGFLDESGSHLETQNFKED